MRIDQIQQLTGTFERHAQQTESGVEFWLARDLQYLFDYRKWDDFLHVVSKAKTACEVLGSSIQTILLMSGKWLNWVQAVSAKSMI